MARFIVGADRQQVTLLPECLDDFITEDNTVRVVDAFIGELDMVALGFEGATPAATGRPSYHPSVLLKLYLYGYRLTGNPIDFQSTVVHDRLLTTRCGCTHPQIRRLKADRRTLSKVRRVAPRFLGTLCCHLAAELLQEGLSRG